MTAIDQALDLPELLESILMHMPMRQLLVAHRVSKRWQTIIQRSPALQQKLFFASSAETPMVYDEDHFFLSSDNDDDENEHESKRPYWHDIKDPEVPVTIVRNPVLEAINLQLSSAYETELRENEVMAKFNDLLPKSWARKDASWRRMMHSQPGSRGVVNSTIASFEGDGSHRMATIRYDDIENGRLGPTVIKNRRMGPTVIETGRLGPMVDQLVNRTGKANEPLWSEAADSAGSTYEFGKLQLEVRDASTWEKLESSEWPFSQREISIGEETKSSAATRQAGED